MIVFENICVKCLKKPVCRFIEERRDLEKFVSEVQKDMITDPNVLSINVKCLEFISGQNNYNKIRE